MNTLTFQTMYFHPKTSDRIIVFLDGLQSTGLRPGPRIAHTLCNYGPLLSAQYPSGHSFYRDRLVSEIYDHIKSFRRITFIGASLGALLGHDVIEYIKQLGHTYELDLIILDGPTGFIDLKNGWARLASHMPAIRLPAQINQLIFRGELPATEELHQSSFEVWKAHVRRSQTFQWQDFVRQLRYLVRHPGPKPEVMESVKTVFIRSAYDKFVKRTAVSRWQEICPQLHLVEAGEETYHVDLLEHPTAWAHALNRGMRLLESQSA